METFIQGTAVKRVTTNEPESEINQSMAADQLDLFGEIFSTNQQSGKCSDK